MYWVMSFKALDTAERLDWGDPWIDPLSHCSGCFDLISDLLMHRLLIRLNYAQEEDSKWEQMIHLWRGLTVKQILEKWTYGDPLT